MLLVQDSASKQALRPDWLAHLMRNHGVVQQALALEGSRRLEGFRQLEGFPKQDLPLEEAMAPRCLHLSLGALH